MKKIFVGLVMLIGLLSGISAKSIFDAVYADDIKSFGKLLNQEGVLDSTTDSGMPLQLAIAQFSDENFETACKMLSEKDFDFDKPAKTGMTLLYLLSTGLSVNKIKVLLNYNVDVNKEVDKVLPIQATQFSTYPFHTEQKINLELFEKEKQIHEMLIEKGSKPFSYISPDIYYFGNFLFAFGNAFHYTNMLVSPQMLNEAEFFNIEEKDKRTIASFKFDVLKEIYAEYGFQFKKVEITYYTDDIVKNINDALADPKKCYILAFTGNSKISPYKWVMIKNFDDKTMKKKKISNVNEKFNAINSDATYDFAEYHIKDITEIIVIKVLEK